MKTNEIPDKIYLSYETDEDDKEHIFIDYMWHKHLFESKNWKNVEYTLTDTFIKKVENFLEMLGYGFTITDNITHTNYDKKQLIEDFKNYVKENKI